MSFVLRGKRNLLHIITTWLEATTSKTIDSIHYLDGVILKLTMHLIQSAKISYVGTQFLRLHSQNKKRVVFEMSFNVKWCISILNTLIITSIKSCMRNQSPTLNKSLKTTQSSNLILQQTHCHCFGNRGTIIFVLGGDASAVSLRM